MAKTSDAAKRVRGLIRETHKWCADPRNDRRESWTKDVRKDFTKNDTRRAAVSLNFFANWYGEYGVHRILDAEMEGWADLDRAVRYRWLYARIGKHVAMQASMVASVLATAVVFDEDAMAEALAARLLQSLDDQKIFSVWIESPFAAFMVKLWGLYRGLEIDVARPKVAPLGVYQRILDAWHDEAALANAVSAACDYHLEQTREAGYPEFYFPPYRLFPADILVIGTVRRKFGLSMPEVFHPLLDTPLAKVPPPTERPRMGVDPLFDEVLARATKDGLLT